MFDRTDRWNAEYAGLLETGDHPCIRPPAETDCANAILVGQYQIDNLGCARLEAVEIHSERMWSHVAKARDFRRRFFRRHDSRCKESECARIARRRNKLWLGHPAHCGLDHWNAAPKSFG